jgi:RimJ/RimL family protein N-acetyltransferase
VQPRDERDFLPDFVRGRSCLPRARRKLGRVTALGVRDRGQAFLRLDSVMDHDVIPTLAVTVRECGMACGLRPTAADDLQTAARVVFELITRVNERDGLDGAEDHLAVEVRRRRGGVSVRIDDRGVPYELTELERRVEAPRKRGGLAGSDLLSLVSTLVDGFEFQTRGREGNRIELFKRFRRHSVLEAAITPEPELDPGAEVAVHVRALSQDDAIEFARAVYRSYGYTYDRDWAYSAEDVQRLLAAGELAGWVGEVNGRVIGQMALKRNADEPGLGEAGLAMISPRFRRHAVGWQLGMTLVQWALDHGLYGIYANATTAHPYSQRGAAKAGGKEVALLLGYIPAEVAYQDIETRPRRVGNMVMYNRLADNPRHPVYAPRRHEAMLRRIFERAGLVGDFTAPPRSAERPARTELGLEVETDHGIALVHVRSAGDDLADAVREQQRRLRRAQVPIVYCDLDLSSPTTPAASEELAALGFFFGGVVPVDDSRGFRLRIQDTNDSDIRKEDVQLGTEFGAELLDYVWADRQQQDG